MEVCVIHGPNLNRLGKREPVTYGYETLEELNNRLIHKGKAFGMKLTCLQSNIEGELIDFIHGCEGRYRYLILNAGAFSHYSYAIQDAITSIDIPVIEVHISNVYARESFRHHSVISSVSLGVITGFGAKGYDLALDYINGEMEGKGGM